MLFLYGQLILLVVASLEVYLVPHSHNDAGWLQNAEWYYENKCKLTLNNMLTILEENPNRKFCWAETFFLSKYLKDFPDRKKDFMKFIKEGRFELISGGWVQNDEALTDFEAVLRQMEAGFDYIKNELNITQIKVGWQVDPFGHPSLTASLWEKMGIESVTLGRIHEDVQGYLQNTSSMEFIWKGRGFGAKNGILTNVLHDGYYLPYFLNDEDIYSGGPCYSSLPASEENITYCAEKLTNYTLKMAPMYESDLLMIPIGRDFFFTDLEQSRLLLDLIETLISRITDITFKIATPSDYFNARFAQSQTTQVYEGDFLPLVSHGGKAWTGFYTTRPFLKKTIYSTQKIARAGEMVQALIKENKLMEYQVSIGFHHDAITGTCRYNVSQDYFARLEKDYNAGMLAIGQAFISVLNKAENPAAVMNPYKVMTIFSPINWVTSRMISFFSKSQYVKIQDGFGNSILSQSVPIQGGFEIYFPYTLASLSFTVLFVNEYSTPCEGCSEPSGLSGSTQVRDQFIGLDFLNGHILRYYNGTKVYDISSSIVAYNASAGGAYMFTPITDAYPIGVLIDYIVYTGDLITVVQSRWQHNSQIYTQRIIIPKGSLTFVLKFNLFAELGLEIFLRFTNPVHADDWFYTFNSADIMFRRYAPITNTSVGHNNYPIPGGLLISTQDTFLHIFPTFPLGAGLPNSEQFELHLHRNPQNDDHFGIGEPLYETYSVEHELLIGLTDMNTGPIWKKYIDYKTTPLVTFLSKEKILTEDLEKAFVMKKDWEFSTEYSLLQETTCAYISSIVERNNELVCRIVNICDELISEKINSLDMIREINAIGGELMERNYASPGGVIEGVVNNSGANFVSYPDVSAVGMISPFDLKTYRMKKNFKYSGTNPLFAFGLFENNHNHHDYTLIYVAFAVVGTISMAIVGLVLAKYCRGNTKLRSEPLI